MGAKHTPRSTRFTRYGKDYRIARGVLQYKSDSGAWVDSDTQSQAFKTYLQKPECPRFESLRKSILAAVDNGSDTPGGQA